LNSNPKNNAKVDEDEKYPYFTTYVSLKDPWPYLCVRGFISAIVVFVAYCVFGYLIPDHPDWFYSASDPTSVAIDVEGVGAGDNGKNTKPTFEELVEDYLYVEKKRRPERMIFLIYLAFYFVMWFTYFQSKIPEKQNCDGPSEVGNDTGRGGLEIQTLRRLLGISCDHWQTSTGKEIDAEVVAAYRAKAGTSMEVIAILIAVSILILDQFTAIWRIEYAEGAIPKLWTAVLLWSGMASAMISCVGFLLAVDALDTTFNRFRTNYVRDRAIRYFYRYAIDPRYAGNASLLLSLVLLLAYHNVMLGSMAIGVIVAVGYDFWFPRLSNLASVDSTPDRNYGKGTKHTLAIFVVVPFIVKILSWVIYA